MKGPVIFDKEIESVVINLPENGKEFGKELIDYLYDNFAFEGINASVLDNMNKKARAWLSRKGINAEWE